MRAFLPIDVDAASLAADLDDLESFLQSKARRKERAEITPFFKSYPSLCAAMGMLNAAVSRPDRYAHELDLFGDFVCDVASGDSAVEAYTLSSSKMHRCTVFSQSWKPGRS